MSKRKYDAMWDIMSQNQFLIDFENSSDITCSICKKILVNANQSSCGCRYCKKCIFTYLEDGPKKCVGTKLECDEEFIDLEDVHTDHRANLVISTLVVACAIEGCTFQTELMKMSDHIQSCHGLREQCLYNSIGCESLFVNTKCMDVHLQKDIVSHTHLLTKWIDNVQNELNDGRLRIQKLEDEVVRLNNQIERQAVVIENQRQDNRQNTLPEVVIDNRYVEVMNRLSMLTTKLENLSIKINEDDDFLWKVDEMKIKVDNARAGIRSIIYSDPFYTHKHGYKIRLSMHPNGYGSHEGSHLYVLFCVMRGDYDDLLPWPLTRAITLGIVDRNTGASYVSYRFTYEDTDSSYRGSFMKPSSNMNMAIGNEEFVRLDTMFKYQNLLKDDSIFIRFSLAP